VEIPTPAMWTCVADIAIVVCRDLISLLGPALFWETQTAKADRHGKVSALVLPTTKVSPQQDENCPPGRCQASGRSASLYRNLIEHPAMRP
jgi:hypothetical protein